MSDPQWLQEVAPCEWLPSAFNGLDSLETPRAEPTRSGFMMEETLIQVDEE